MAHKIKVRKTVFAGHKVSPVELAKIETELKQVTLSFLASAAVDGVDKVDAVRLSKMTKADLCYELKAVELNESAVRDIFERSLSDFHRFLSLGTWRDKK